MLFSSITFLYFFLPIFLIVYYVTPRQYRNIPLLIASLLFYAWGGVALCALLVFFILLGWLSGMLIEEFHWQGQMRLKQAVLWISLSVCLFLLGYFKYTDFLIGSINGLFQKEFPLKNIVLPIGISFYTFQVISYLADVYWGKVSAQKSLVRFATYVSMFPQLIAGPIVRYQEIENVLDSKQRLIAIDDFDKGMKRFVIGLSKKVLIANAMGEIVESFRISTDLSVLYFWLYALCYALQIYYDFSGYSDMAIGLGRMLGFSFPENFNYPYIARSVTEFWRRWHMTLGGWFRDYVYIPLGGNRCRLRRQVLNISIVWLLTGLWHGADYHFLAWGIFYAMLLTLEKQGLLNWLNRHKIMGHIYVSLTILFGFVLFGAESFGELLTRYGGMLGLLSIPLISIEARYELTSNLPRILLAIVGVTPLPVMLMTRIRYRVGDKEYDSVRANKSVRKKIFVRKLFWWTKSIVETLVPTGLLLLVTAYLLEGSFNPFLYFAF